MKAFTYILTLLTLFFVANVAAFVFVDDYRFLLRKIKYPEMSIYVNESNITDEYWIIEHKNSEREDVFISEIETNAISKTEIKVVDELEKNPDEIPNDLLGNTRTVDVLNPIPDDIDRALIESFILSEFERKILDSFDATYSLVETEFPSNIYGLIFDYEADFWKYSSWKLDLYFFWETPYEDVKNHLIDSSVDTWIIINEVNNFWEKSLYVNWENHLVRLLIEQNGYTFSVEVLKTEYETVKNILNSL